jgi:branched-chain amino acid transport system substrate-binding protein
MDSDGYYVRTAPPDALQAEAMSDLLDTDGRRQPLIVAPKDTYGRPFARQILAALREAEIDGATELYAPGSDPAAVAERAVASEPDAIVLVGYPGETAPIIAALAADGHGPNQFPVYGTDGLQSADLGAMVDPANPAVVAGMRGTVAAGTPGGTDHPFHRRMLDAGVEPFFSASAYDCTILIGLAAIAAESDNARAIRESFAGNLTGKTPCNSFAECATRISDGQRIRYTGAFSAYDRWQGSEPGSGTFDVWTMGLDGRPTSGPAETQIHVG